MLDSTPEPGEENTEYIDAKGSYIAPGFVDIHVHGGGGAEFMCDNVEDVKTVCATHLLTAPPSSSAHNILSRSGSFN